MGVDGRAKSNRRMFQYDRVFGPPTSQSDLFNEVGGLVQSALDGKHVCVFAYGQTGSGKTHTMIGGADESAGFMPRAFEMIFRGEDVANASMSVFEIYNEQVRCLLGGGSRLEVTSTSGAATSISGAIVKTVSDASAATEVLQSALAARAVGSTGAFV